MHTLVVLLCLAGLATAEETPVAAPRPPEPPALRYARRDARETAAWAQEARESVETAADADKAAAEKAAKEAQAHANRAAARLARLETAGSLRPDPKAMHEIAAFKHERPMIACRIGGDGRYLFAGSQDAVLQRWDMLRGSGTALSGHQTWIRGLALRADRDLLISGDYSGRLIWWSPLDPSPQPLRTVEAHQGSVRAVALSPDGQLVATGGNDNVVRIWSAADGGLIAELAGHERHVYNVAFHPSGRFLVSGDLMGVLKQWDVGTWKHVRDLDAGVLSKYDKTFRADCGGIRAIDFSPDGRLLAVGGITDVTNAFAGVGQPAVVLFDWETGERLKVLKPAKKFQGSVWGLRFHPSGDFLVAVGGGSSGAVWFFKTDAEQSFFDMKLPQVGYDLDFHPDGLRLAVALYDKTVRLYDLTRAAPIAKDPPGKPPRK